MSKNLNNIDTLYLGSLEGRDISVIPCLCPCPRARPVY